MRLLGILLFIPVFVFAGVGFSDSEPGILDTLSPSITLTSPVEGDSFEYEVPFVWEVQEHSISEAVDAVMLSVIGPDETVIYSHAEVMNSEGSYNFTWEATTTLPEGSYWQIEATDALGNSAFAAGGTFNATNTPVSVELPTVLTLEQAKPNPFNPQTTIRFYNPKEGMTSLKIYDINGRLVKTLYHGQLEKDWHELTWRAKGHASGAYFARLISGNETRNIKLMLLK
ncbi:MAG: T9SS type A sorting domain-containing protein [bacterium]|nr:T9SS type A sorting domain-containing protein [bacterium]